MLKHKQNTQIILFNEMHGYLSKEECELILKDESDWKLYDLDFRYYYKLLDNEWLDSKLRSLLENEKKIITTKKIQNRVIKLPKGFIMPKHSFDYINTSSLYRETIFTSVIFLNEDFIGGEYFFNNIKYKIKTGYGVIHDRYTTQKINKIQDGELYMLFSHFSDILVNKLF